MAKVDVAQEQLVLSFHTPVAEVDADAVAATLRAVVKLIEAAKDEVTPSTPLEIKARPFAPGSLEVPLIVSIGAGVGFVLAHLEQINATLALVKQFIEIKLLVRGKPIPAPDASGTIDIGHLSIQNSGVINIFQNSIVNQSVSDAAAAIEADETIKGFKVLQGEQRTPIVVVEREQLGYLHYNPDRPTVEIPKERERVVRTSLSVRSPDLLGDAKWAFNHNDHRIEASVQDARFVAEVRAAERAFTAGTILIVDLQVHEEYDLKVNGYVPKKYSILKVHSQQRQKRLDERPKQSRQRKNKRRGQ